MWYEVSWCFLYNRVIFLIYFGFMRNSWLIFVTELGNCNGNCFKNYAIIVLALVKFRMQCRSGLKLAKYLQHLESDFAKHVEKLVFSKLFFFFFFGRFWNSLRMNSPFECSVRLRLPAMFVEQQKSSGPEILWSPLTSIQNQWCCKHKPSQICEGYKACIKSLSNIKENYFR